TRPRARGRRSRSRCAAPPGSHARCAPGSRSESARRRPPQPDTLAASFFFHLSLVTPTPAQTAARKLTRQDLREAAENFKNGGRGGPNDETGTLTFTQPEDIVAAARLVRKGKVISPALNFDQHGPQGAKSPYPAMGRINPVHTMLRTGTD